jgi:hypothetical protein
VSEKCELTDLEKDILAYLDENPFAQDTAEGITQWWLLQQKILQAISAVEKALANLVAHQLLTKHEGPDGKIYYRVRKKRGRSGAGKKGSAERE